MLHIVYIVSCPAFYLWEIIILFLINVILGFLLYWILCFNYIWTSLNPVLFSYLVSWTDWCWHLKEPVRKEAYYLSTESPLQLQLFFRALQLKKKRKKERKRKDQILTVPPQVLMSKIVLRIMDGNEKEIERT